LINVLQLQGVICVGSYRAGKIPQGFNGSPFNANEAIKPADLLFKPDETRALFGMAQEDWGMRLDDGVIDHIHTLTAG